MPSNEQRKKRIPSNYNLQVVLPKPKKTGFAMDFARKVDVELNLTPRSRYRKAREDAEE